jgi:hypothetical protein
VRGRVWESIDLEGKRLFVEHQATRRRADVTYLRNSHPKLSSDAAAGL